MRRGILFLSFLFFFGICSSVSFALASGPTRITRDISGTETTTWIRDDSPYIIVGMRTVGTPLVIEAGVVVKFEKGISNSLRVQNDFFVKGTAEEPVVFTSIRDDSIGGDTNNDQNKSQPQRGDWSSISFSPWQDKTLDINYAKVRYSSFGINIFAYDFSKNRTVKNCELTNNGYGIAVYNAEPVIEGNVFTNNSKGVWVGNNDSRIAKATGNSFSGNETGVFANKNGQADPSLVAIDARFNWWGDPSGPMVGENDPDGKRDRAWGAVLYDPWMKEYPAAGPDPVIIIPGIMGSWEVDGKWKIDPIFHTYDNLRDEFLANGYEDGEDDEEGGNLFTFPYEWRDSNVDNAILLQKKIEDVKDATGRSKVDIVAHSMGGLLAREYIESDDYDDDVDQLITVGTPQLGAPKDYIKWEAGAFFSDIFETAGKYFFKQESKENNYDSIFHYIRAEIPSVQELLPVYDYIYDDNGSDYDLRIGYPANYPRNEFLENLNDVEKIKALKNVEFTKIVGNPTGQSTTISGYNVVNADMGELWEHGYPHGFEIPWIGDQGLRKSDGDGTVPLYSAEALNIPADESTYLESEHNNLPTDAQQDILEILTGKIPGGKKDEWKIDDILIGMVFSPVDVQIEDKFGRKIGKKFSADEKFEEIPGAFYSGFDKPCPSEDEPDKRCEIKAEFFTIPDPIIGGEYKIVAEGTGEGGAYKIETARIIKDEANPQEIKESTAIIEGVAEDGVKQETKIQVTEEEVIYNFDTTPPVITVTSPKDNETYLNDNYALDFSSVISDTGSGIEESSVEKILNGQPFNDEKLDLSLKNLGSYSYQVRAKDKVGNFGSTEVAFQNTTNLKAIQNNVGHYLDLGLIKKKIAKRYLETRLKHLEKLFDLLEKTKKSRLRPEPRQTAVRALEKIINAKVDLIIRQIKHKSPHWIDQMGVDLLAGSLGYLKTD